MIMDPKKKPTDPDRPNDEPEKPVAIEVGGRKGPDPTRYDDYEKDGRCIDF